MYECINICHLTFIREGKQLKLNSFNELVLDFVLKQQHERTFVVLRYHQVIVRVNHDLSHDY